VRARCGSVSRSATTCARVALTASIGLSQQIEVTNMSLKADTRHYVRSKGAQHEYEIEIRVDAQTYLIRRAGDLLKEGGAGASVLLDASAMYELACADIEDVVGMTE
jgi:hypothetical protein